MNKAGLIPILIFSKVLTSLLKVTNKGSGTALPGLIIGKYFPKTTEKLIEQIPNIIVVTGTNGKTTTQTILRSILEISNEKVITNAAGANLRRGILSQLLKEASISGKIDCKYAIFEVEEATFPKVVQTLNPDIIAVTNLYRDQLDAYGEVDITEKYIRSAIEKATDAKVILNKDDPRVSRLTEGLDSNETHYISLPTAFTKNLPYEGINDNHEKDFPNTINAENIKINNDLTTTFDINGEFKNSKLKILDLKLASPGYFHVYNALFAASIAKLLNISEDNIKNGIEQFMPAFGRGELITKKEGEKSVDFRLLLIKNPAGFSLNLELIKKIDKLKLVILINDNTADGKDVSWLWDSKLEILNEANIEWILCGGSRAKDMKLRLKYAFDNLSQINAILVKEDIKSIIDSAFESANNGDTIFVLPTYTAMLEFRKLLGKKLE